jgi:phosphoserine phosphatase
MAHVLILVSPSPLADETVRAFADRMSGAAIRRLGPNAAEIETRADTGAELVAAAQGRGLDAAFLPAAGRRKKLLVADMDSTIIGQECIDELAALAGAGPEIAAITERAMRGELDFEAALEERVGRLAGSPAHLIDRVCDQRLSLNPGAQTLVRTMRWAGAECVLVSGGFTVFTRVVAERAGFSSHRGNRLGVDADGALDGTVGKPILGRDAKARALVELAEEAGLDLDQTLAIGDGANDLAMIGKAGLGIAYKAKPVVAAAAKAAILHTDLSAALYYQGYTVEEFA